MAKEFFIRKEQGAKKYKGKRKREKSKAGKTERAGKRRTEEKESGKEGKRKTENDKERNGIKPQALYNHAQGFLVTKKDPAKPDLFSI